jgi:hypothetical protein
MGSGIGSRGTTVVAPENAERPEIADASEEVVRCSRGLDFGGEEEARSKDVRWEAAVLGR